MPRRGLHFGESDHDKRQRELMERMYKNMPRGEPQEIPPHEMYPPTKRKGPTKADILRRQRDNELAKIQEDRQQTEDMLRNKVITPQEYDAIIRALDKKEDDIFKRYD